MKKPKPKKDQRKRIKPCNAPKVVRNVAVVQNKGSRATKVSMAVAIEKTFQKV